MIGSALIRWATNSDCSHIAIGFDLSESGKGLVFHQSAGGLHVDSWYSFKKKYTINHRKDYDLGLVEEEKVYQGILDTLGPVGYDYQGIVYGILVMMRRKLFGVALPKSNEWQNPRSFLCTGIMSVLVNFEPWKSIVWPNDFESMIPHDIYNNL